MNTEEKKYIYFGNPGFFLLLSIILMVTGYGIIMSGPSMIDNREISLLALISIFGAGGLTLIGTIVSFIRWNKLDYMGKLLLFILFILLLIWVALTLPAL